MLLFKFQGALFSVLPDYAWPMLVLALPGVLVTSLEGMLKAMAELDQEDLRPNAEEAAGKELGDSLVLKERELWKEGKTYVFPFWVVFSIEVGRKTYWICDSPWEGFALYVFTSKKAALELAGGKLTRWQARQDKKTFVKRFYSVEPELAPFQRRARGELERL